jgi:hypothetical protein
MEKVFALHIPLAKSYFFKCSVFILKFWVTCAYIDELQPNFSMVTHMATMTRGLKLSELASMNTSERAKHINRLFEDAFSPSEEQNAELTKRIAAFESKYKMSSGEMKRLLSNGELEETTEICSWLMLLEV